MTGAWVTGLEAVVPPGEIVAVGGPIRKDVAGYDLKALLIGSEGTLGVITAAWLKLLPAPEAALPVVAFHAGTEAGCRAIEGVLGAGLTVAALEYLDGGALAAAGASFPGAVPEGAGFMVIAEADGTEAEAERLQGELVEALGPGALGLQAPVQRREVEALWRWRDGVSIAVEARRGGKVSEDIVVPLDRLRRGDRGDGLDREASRVGGLQLGPRRRREPALDLPGRRPTTAGSWSGRQAPPRSCSSSRCGWEDRSPASTAWAGSSADSWRVSGRRGRSRLHEAVKRAFDPKGLMNPQKKIAS